MRANAKIREYAKKCGVRLWQIADALGIQESRFSKILRKELNPEDTQKVMTIIQNLAQNRREVG